MRSRLLLVPVLALMLLGVVRAEDEGPAVVEASPGALAEAILDWEGADLSKTAERVAALDAVTLLNVFHEIRSQTRIRGILRGKRVKDWSVSDASLEDILHDTLDPLQVPWLLSDAARVVAEEEVQVTLQLGDVSVVTVIALVTEPYELRTVIRDGVVWVVTAKEGERGVEVSPEARMRAQVERRTLTLSLDSITLGKALASVEAATGFYVRIDPRVEKELREVEITGLVVEDAPLPQILSMLAAAGGEDVVWTVKGNVVLFTRRHLLPR